MGRLTSLHEWETLVFSPDMRVPKRVPSYVCEQRTLLRPKMSRDNVSRRPGNFPEIQNTFTSSHFLTHEVQTGVGCILVTAILVMNVVSQY
jgi:hypothetical protein